MADFSYPPAGGIVTIMIDSGGEFTADVFLVLFLIIVVSDLYEKEKK